MALKIFKKKLSAPPLITEKTAKHLVLLVDDEKNNLITMASTLEDLEGVKTLIASDGKSALELLQQLENPEKLHAILSDQRMPGLSGVEFLEKTIAIVPKCIRMIITGYTDIGMIIDSINKSQIYKFLTKPVGPMNLRITVQRALEAHLLEEAQELAKLEAERANAANKAKSEFLSSLSHEIRTPMNSILGFSEILVNKLQDSSYKYYLEAIQTSGQTLLRLIDDVLDLSKIEAGKLQLQATPINPFQVFKEMQTIFYHKTKEKALEFQIECSLSTSVSVLLDELRLRQILMNLLSNSFKFTESGHIRLVANGHTSSESLNRLNLQFSVEDTGIGIASDQTARIFEAFEQKRGQNYAEYGGTGLGLAITKKIVEQMGGTIHVDSEEGRGSIFSVELPNCQIISEAEPQQESIEFDPNSIRFAHQTVLILDDVELNRELVKQYLDFPDLKVLGAKNGQEGLSLVHDYNPDLIITDVRMPIMDGSRFAQHLKTNPLLNKIPIIVLTASTIKQEEEAIRQYCDKFLRKPIKRKTLVSEVMKFLKHTLHENGSSPQEHDTFSFETWTGTSLSYKERIAFHEALAVEIVEWKTVHNTSAIKKIKDFSIKIQDLGKQYHCLPLEEWAEKLAYHANSYDIATSQKTMENFPDKVANLYQTLKRKNQ